ncbi:hypothetical protein F5Y15DRAFT_234463 [Xylariaceae sp. FL0016]|nr:hypothetical protein F5Y15DRAFT_234463 [Xylariaceae sp. FL0016]
METQQPSLWGVLLGTFIPATICIFLRLLSRRLTRVHLWWDDYAAIAAYLIAVAWMIIVPIWINAGLGLHIDDIQHLTQAEALYTSKLLLYIAELFYAFALFFGKVSILFFYWRMFRVTNIKLPVKILLGCAVVWIIIRTIMGIFHCAPVQYFWDPSVEGHCDIDDSKFFFGTILIHVLMDVVIISLPVVQIKKLRLPTLQKVGVMLMFMFGIFICAAAIVIMNLAVTFDATSVDFSWNVASIVLWATVEVNLVNVSTCLPTVKPGFNFCFRCALPDTVLGSGSGSYDQSYGNAYGTKKSIRLGTMPTKHDNDESSSTYQLAESANGSTTGEFEHHAVDGPRGLRTFITGRQRDDGGASGLEEGEGGIRVKNETTVHVSRTGGVKSPYPDSD